MSTKTSFLVQWHCSFIFSLLQGGFQDLITFQQVVIYPSEDSLDFALPLLAAFVHLYFPPQPTRYFSQAFGFFPLVLKSVHSIH
jgi:hypothetical protein